MSSYLRHQYHSNKNIQTFIDVCTEITFDISRKHPGTGIYGDDMLRLIIKEYFLIGRVCVDFFVKSNHQIYDPDQYIVYPLPGSSKIVIKYKGKDISQQVIYLKRSMHPYDYMGVPIMVENSGEVNAFSFNSFSTELSNALSCRHAKTGEHIV